MASVTKWSVALLALSFFDYRKFLILLFLAALIKVVTQEWTTRSSQLTVYRSVKISLKCALAINDGRHEKIEEKLRVN